jgi:hypothetical protein
VVLQRGGVRGLRDVLEELEHDGSVARGGEVDFLVVGDFADGARCGELVCEGEGVEMDR